MNTSNSLAVAIRRALLLGTAGLFAHHAAAQTIAVANDQTEIQEEASTADPLLEESDDLLEEADERITVTGSRLRRSEFSSASPIQVVNGDIARSMGMFSAEDMLQNTTQASGLQVDSSFGGFVLDNGPGSSTIGFRGLGEARTLVMLNGRRIAPAGVGGAPVAADLNLIPGVMIDRIENLFDGASTVYGSDAISGVANILLKSDVEGFDVQASYADPQAGGGEEEIVSVMYGTSSDNSNFSIGIEYANQNRQTIRQNPFTSDCEELYYEDEQGNILNEYRGVGPSALPTDGCSIFPLTNRVFFNNFYGSLYRTPGYTNTGIPNFSETNVSIGFTDLGDSQIHPTWIGVDTDGDGIPDNGIVDGNGDGLMDISFQDPYYAFGRSDRMLNGDFIGEVERVSVLATGDYNFQDDNDTTIFYEALYAQRDANLQSPSGQFFPVVPVDNPFNPCGSYAPDCFLDFLGFEWGPVTAQPILNIRGDRDEAAIDVYQVRLVTGISGNINALQDVGAGNWFYEGYAAYSDSKGTNTLQGIHQGRLATSLAAVVDDAGNITCGDGSDGCVPVNLFADNIYQNGGGSFTQAEADYLFAERYMETKVKQVLFNGYIGGDLLTLPWNSEAVPIVFGFEYRKDEIESNPNDVASEGLLMHYFTDQGADGSRHMRELYTELELPLLRGKKYAEELTLAASGRWTDESFYDPARTYSLKTVYRPVKWFTVRGTKGASYRAPNLRERFLNGTTGFNSITDPCVVPEAARIENPNDLNALPSYDATQDDRPDHVFSACAAAGVDPTSLGIASQTATVRSTYNSEVNSGGSEDISDEKSTAKTWGMIFEQPFSEAFDLSFSASWFNIEITNSIVEPSLEFVIDQCFDNPDAADGSSGFCERITRDSDNLISLVDTSFINAGYENSRGVDYNLYYEQDLLVGEHNVTVSLDVLATNLRERSLNLLGVEDDNAGEPSYPKWRGYSQLSIGLSDFRFSWLTRYIKGGELDNPQEFDTNNRPCRGLADVACRPIYYTTSYVRHDASLRWAKDNYSVTFGVRNLFDKAPPIADGDGVFSSYNVPLGIGYDLFGRTFYASGGMQF